jgi:hypothetical protein
MSDKSKLTYFVSQRSINVGGLTGQRITMYKGVPTHVPRDMHVAVLNRGAQPCNEKGEVIEDQSEIIDFPDPDSPDPMKAPPALTAEERAEKIGEAFDRIVEENNPHDFSGSTPSHEAVTRIVGFRTDSKEVRQIWTKVRRKYLAKKEEVE